MDMLSKSLATSATLKREGRVPRGSISYRNAAYIVALVVSIMAFIPPEGLSMIGLSRVTISWKMFMIAVLAILLLAFVRGSIVQNGYVVDTTAVLILLIIVLLGLYTLFQNGSIYYYGQKVAYIAGPWLICVIFLKKDPRLFIKVLSVLFLIICVLNLITIAMYLPRGSFRPEIGDYWLFGQRTYMRNILFPGLLFSLIDDRLDGRRLSPRSIFFLITNPISLYLVNSMTSLTLCLLSECAIVVLILVNRKIQLLKILLAGSVIVDIVIVHIRHIAFLEKFIVNTLGRNITFSGRTQVWDLSIDVLMRNPLYGTGIQTLEDSGFTLLSSKQLSNAHNEFLDLTFKGGIVTAIAWVILVVKCCLPLVKNKTTWISSYLGLFIGIFLFESILGDVFYPEVFLILYMAAYLDDWIPIAKE